ITFLFEAEEQIDFIATEVELVVPIPGNAGSWRGVGRFFLTFGLPIPRMVLATVVRLEFSLQLVSSHFGHHLGRDLFAIALASHFKRDLVTRQGDILERSLIAIAANDYAAQFVTLLFELEGGFNGLSILRGEGRFPCAGEIVLGRE